MIRSVTVTNMAKESLILPINVFGPYIVTDIQGLGPVNANVNVTDYASRDGGYFQSTRMQTRNITFTILYNDDYDIETLRHKLYRYFSVKSKVDLVFETDERRLSTHGYVESNEVNIFTNREMSTISIICTNPYFNDADNAEQSVRFSEVVPSFEFPFSNPEGSSTLIMGDIATTKNVNIVYRGDASTGFMMHLYFKGPATKIKVFNVQTAEFIELNNDILELIVGSPIKDGDEIIISTVIGSKSALFNRSNSFKDILGAVSRASTWFQLHEGDNLISYSAETGRENIEIVLNYKMIYEGV